MTARRLVLLAVVAIAVAIPASALGSKPKPSTVAPTPSERAAIIKAFGDPKKASPCLIVRLAASNHNYATLKFRKRKSCRHWAFNGVNVIKHVKRGHWKVVFEGSAFSCPLPRIPRRVQRDLGVCP